MGGVTVQHTGGGCLKPLQLPGGTGELNTKPKLNCIVQVVVQHGNWMQIWWLSTTTKIERGQIQELTLDPYCCNWGVYSPLLKIVNSVHAFRLLVRRPIQKCILCWGSVGKVRLQKQWKWHRRYSPAVACPCVKISRCGVKPFRFAFWNEGRSDRHVSTLRTSHFNVKTLWFTLYDFTSNRPRF